MEPLKFNTLDNLTANNPVDTITKQALQSIQTTKVAPPHFELPSHFVPPVIERMERDQRECSPEFVVAYENEQKGPYSMRQIKQMLTSGELSENTYIWKTGLSEWITIKDYFVQNNI